MREKTMPIFMLRGAHFVRDISRKSRQSPRRSPLNMEISLQIDHYAGLVRGTFGGEVSTTELQRGLDVFIAEGVLGYRKLYDGTQLLPRFTVMDLQNLRTRMLRVARSMVIGPTAVVPPQGHFGLYRMWEDLMADIYEIHPCRCMAEAEEWISSHPSIAMRH